MISTLKCFSCGKEQVIEHQASFQFGFEIAKTAQDIGWVGVIDHVHQRSVVFCSDDCLHEQRTKNGGIRLHTKALSRLNA